MRVQDYREVPEHDFDGICSIGMMEHVGVKNYQSYFEEMFRLLKPMGRLLNHQITISHDKPHGKPGTDEFLDRYIFPDGDLGAPGFIESCIHDAGFNVVHQENLRQHYALTLHHWNQNLSEHWDDAVKQVGFERAKVWGMYMAACALNFELDGIQIHQFLAVKPDRVGHPDGKWYLCANGGRPDSVSVGRTRFLPLFICRPTEVWDSRYINRLTYLLSRMT